MRMKLASPFATFVYESFETVAKLQYLGTTSTNRKWIREAVNGSLHSAEDSYVSVWNLLSFALVSKDTWIKICESISLSSILYGCETWFRRLQKIGVRALKNRLLRRISVRKNEKKHDSGDNWITVSSGGHLCPWPNFIRGITSRRTRGTGKS